MDRNRLEIFKMPIIPKSLSARRAWIEIQAIRVKVVLLPVALRKESVDRNIGFARLIGVNTVALRKESVDRNEYDKRTDRSNHVALRKESVDRNIAITYKTDITISSLSARRAWIEIGISGVDTVPY